MTTARPIGAIWWRTSTKAQTESSPETQIREAREMLEAQGYSVPDDYIIGADWHSLSILDCPKMETLLGWVRHGEIQAIGMYHGDRLAGNPGQKMFIVDLCERQGVKLLARHSPIIEGKEGELLEYVRTGGKEQQVIRAQQASKDGLRDRVLLKGLPPCAQTPYGYEFARHEDGSHDYTHIVATKDWSVAAYIWRRALEGTSMRRIIRELYQRGTPSPRGKQLWPVSTIGTSILKNPTYSGRYYALRSRSVAPSVRRADTYGKSSQERKPMEEWAYLPNVVVDEPIVTWAEYLEVQDRLEKNKRFSARNAKSRYLLRGMIVCETHDRVFGGWPGKREKDYRYICRVSFSQAVLVGEKCIRRSISGPSIEGQVWTKAADLLSTPETVVGELNRRGQIQEQTEVSIAQRLDHAEKRLKANEAAEMELVSLRIRGDVADNIFQRQKSLLNAERSWLTEETPRLQRQVEQLRQAFATVDQINALRQRVANKLDKADFDTKRMVLETLETRVSVPPDGAIKLSFSISAPAVERDVDGAIVSTAAPAFGRWAAWRTVRSRS